MVFAFVVFLFLVAGGALLYAWYAKIGVFAPESDPRPGADAAEDDNAESGTTVAAQAARNTTVEESTSAGTYLLVLLGAVLAVVFIGGGAYWFLKERKEDEEPEKVPDDPDEGDEGNVFQTGGEDAYGEDVGKREDQDLLETDREDEPNETEQRGDNGEGGSEEATEGTEYMKLYQEIDKALDRRKKEASEFPEWTYREERASYIGRLVRTDALLSRNLLQDVLDVVISHVTGDKTMTWEYFGDLSEADKERVLGYVNHALYFIASRRDPITLGKSYVGGRDLVTFFSFFVSLIKHDQERGIVDASYMEDLLGDFDDFLVKIRKSSPKKNEWQVADDDKAVQGGKDAALDQLEERYKTARGGVSKKRWPTKEE